MTAELSEMDSLDMVGAALRLPSQVEQAASLASDAPDLPPAEHIRSVLILGTGTESIAGDVVAAIAAPEASVPVVVHRDYGCPAWVGPDTLVLAVSFSGDADETVDAATSAAAAGARIVVMASGGRLVHLADEWDVPLVRMDMTLGARRSGIGAATVTPLVVLERLGLLTGVHAQVGAAVDQLRRRADRFVAGNDDARRIARRIGRTMPLVYGGSALGGAAAARWKSQFNQNPKVPAWANRIPELTHDEVAGWAVNGDVTRQVLTMVLLRHDSEDPRVSRRFDAVAEVCDEVVADVVSVFAEGEGPLAQFFDLTLVGEMASLHVAAELGVDPGPVPVRHDLEARVRE